MAQAMEMIKPIPLSMVLMATSMLRDVARVVVLTLPLRLYRP